MENKENIIKWIAKRIKDEQRKHSSHDENWHEIAARKICATYDVKINNEISYINHLKKNKNNMKTKKVTELEYGDKIEMLLGFIRTVKNVEVNGKDATVYYIDGGHTYVLSDEEIELR